jgi:hypothetical protein
MPYACTSFGQAGIRRVGAATLRMRLRAIGLAAALVLAQLLWSKHEAEAAAHAPGEVCDVCLALANINHALVEVTGLPPPRHDLAPADQRPATLALTSPVRELRARAPPDHRG